MERKREGREEGNEREGRGEGGRKERGEGNEQEGRGEGGRKEKGEGEEGRKENQPCYATRKQSSLHTKNYDTYKPK